MMPQERSRAKNHRKLTDSVSVEEITEIEVSGSNSNYYSNDYEDEEFIEGDDYF